jgi:periplasmic divalent cation tolerance protein
MSEFIQVVTTVEHREDGERIARLVVAERLAACVQISGPMLSVYPWQGQIEEAHEYRVTLKSRRTLFAQLEKILEANHPYDVPEIIATPLVCCSKQYQQWLEDSL